MQNGLDGKAGEVIPIPGDNPPLHQLRLRHGQRVGFRKQVIDHADNFGFLGNQLQLEGFLFLAVHRDLLFPFGFKPGRCSSAQPASGLCQLVHVVPDALGNGFPFQLGENGGNVHHGTAHGRPGVKLLLDGHKGNIQPCQFFNQAGKVADIAADSVKPIDNDCLELPLLGSSHHLLEIRAIQIAAGEAFILIDHQVVKSIIPIMRPNVLFAKLNLIPDAFTLAGKLGFSGIDGDGVFVLLHGLPPRLCDVYIAIISYRNRK